MNRREALAALIALPQIASIQRADIKPNDVIVVECDGLMSQRGKDNVLQKLAEIWPGRKIIICDGGVKLRVVSG